MAKAGAMKLIISFVGRGQGNDLAKFYAEYNVNFNYRCVGVFVCFCGCGGCVRSLCAENSRLSL